MAAINALKSSKLLFRLNISLEEHIALRRMNWRFIITGFVLVLLALGFYFFMMSVASTSTDPAALMQTVGTVSGAAIGVSVALILLGLIGKKFS